MASTSGGIHESSGSIFYTPDKGCFAEEGKSYEKNVTAFIALEALYNVDDFCLISNPINCAPFDDIILCTKTNGANIIYLFQIKSKLNPTEITDDEFTTKICNKIKSKFFIGTLYEKYPQGINEIRKIIPQCYGKGCKFEIVIFTNRPMQENSGIFNVAADRNIFTTTQGKIYKFTSEFIKKEGCSDKRDFLQSINVYAQQCDIDNTSTRWIKQYLNSEDNMAKKIKFEYFRCVKNWCEIITEKESLTKEFIYKLITHAAFKNFAVPIENYNEIDYGKYKELLQNVRLVCWESIDDDNITISCEHIQYILGLALEDLHKANINNKNYEQIISDGLQLMQTKYDTGCLLGILPYIVQDFDLTMPRECLKNFKIVFVDSNGGGSQVNLPKIAEALNKLKLSTITGSSGQSFKIGYIIEETSEHISISNVLSLIISYGTNKDKNKDLFIKRKLNKVILDPKIFSYKKSSSGKDEKFIINTNGIKANDFIQLFDVEENLVFAAETENEIAGYFGLYEKPLQSSEDISYKYILINKDGVELKTQTSINVHFLNLFIDYEGTCRIEWIKSNGDTESIKNFRINMSCLQNETTILEIYGKSGCECCVHLEDIICHFQNRFLIISGVPGIGKTTFLKQFACIAPTNDLILFVTLMEFYDYFELFETGESASAENHISHFYKEQDNVFKQFFASKLKKKQVIILFDGFDEIAPRYTFTVSEIIKEIRRQNYKVILTTRSILDDKVESLFGTFSIKLCPLGKASQLSFLKMYFDNIAGDVSIDSFEFQNIIVTSTNDEFRMVPLNLHLICEVLYEELQKKTVLPNNFTLNNLELYEKFVSLKLKIYTEKISNKNIDKSIINSYHTYFSISKLFNKLRDFNMIRVHLEHALLHFSNQLKTGAEKVGILIDDINEIFIHRTVAEYYAAKWLFEIIKPTSDCQHIKNEKRFAIYVWKLIYSLKINYKFNFFAANDNIDFAVIKSFLDSMIVNENKLHEAAIEGNYDYIKNILHSDVAAAKSLNCLNRTLLHTIILKNDMLFIDKNTEKLNSKLVQVLNLLLTNFPDILLQKDLLDATIHDYVKQKKSDKIKIILHQNFVYCNRDFEMWDLFCQGNFYKCDIRKVLQALEVENKIYTVFDAAINGSVTAIQEFCESGLNTNIFSENNRHLIHVAAENGHLDTVIFLNKFSGEKLNRKLKLKDNNNRTVLHYSVLSGNLDLIIHLSENKVNLLSDDVHGLTAFHYAVILNQVDIAKYFLTQDFNINYKCKNGYLPVQYAAAFGNNEMLKFLLTEGANISCKNIINEIPLMHVTISSNIYIIGKLNQMFAPRNLIHKKLLYIREEYNKKCYDIIHNILVVGGDINLKNQFGETPLLTAVILKSSLWVKFLLDNRADVNCRYHNGCTILHVAAYKRNIKILKLISRHIDVSIKDNDNNSALHYALQFPLADCFETVDFLIKSGVDPQSANNEGITPLHWAANNGTWQALKLLLKYTNINVQDHYGYTALHYALLKRDSNLAQHLIYYQADVNLPNCNNEFPLDIATKLELKDIALTLKEMNAKSNETRTVNLIKPYSIKDNDNNSALHYALENKAAHCFETVDFLIKSELVQSANKEGMAPLHYAAYNGDLEVLQLLFNYTNINIPDSYSNTALHYALLKGDSSLGTYLINNQANVNLQNCYNECSLDIALNVGLEEISSILKEMNATSNEATTVNFIQRKRFSKEQHFFHLRILSDDLLKFCCQEYFGISDEIIDEISWDDDKLFRQFIHNCNEMI